MIDAVCSLSLSARAFELLDVWVGLTEVITTRGGATSLSVALRVVLCKAV